LQKYHSFIICEFGIQIEISKDTMMSFDLYQQE